MTSTVPSDDQPFERAWPAGSRRPLIRQATILTVIIGLVAAGTVGAAISGNLPIFQTDRVVDCVPDQCGNLYAVSARAVTPGGAFLGLNVVLAAEARLEDAERIATTLAEGAAGRVIVRFFSVDAGNAKYAFDPIPTGSEAVPAPTADGFLGMIEYRPGRPPVIVWSR